MIKQMIEDLLTLDDAVWDGYAMRNEPLLGRITPEQKAEFIKNSHACGKSLAREVRTSCDGASPEAYAQKLGITVETVPGADGGDYTMFAFFNEPDKISVFQETTEAAEALVREEDLAAALGNVKVRDVLVAHELYHYFECSRPELYTNRKLLSLWKIGPLKTASKVVSLQEIGAMAFARELLSLGYSPFLFDVLLLYTENKRLAKKLYESILKRAGMAGKGED